MSLVIGLPWLQITFEYYDKIRILYMEKTFWWVRDRTDACDIST